MHATRFDALAVTQAVTLRRSRRGVIGGLLGGFALLGWSDGQDVAAANCGKIKNPRKRRKCRRQDRKQCVGKNWCVDRTQTCGPNSGYGKCLITVSGRNFCGELLFQAATCAACEPPHCVDCRCVPAEGGTDRCNNGATGFPFVCARPL